MCIKALAPDNFLFNSWNVENSNMPKYLILISSFLDCRPWKLKLFYFITYYGSRSEILNSYKIWKNTLHLKDESSQEWKRSFSLFYSAVLQITVIICLPA